MDKNFGEGTGNFFKERKCFEKVACPLFLFWLPVYLYAAIIFFLSSIPPLPTPVQLPFIDKFFHLAEYAIFGFLLARAFRNSRRIYFKANFRLLAIGCAILYGLTDELHQAFLPFRDASLFDLLFDGLGAMLGQLVVFKRGG